MRIQHAFITRCVRFAIIAYVLAHPDSFLLYVQQCTTLDILNAFADYENAICGHATVAAEHTSAALRALATLSRQSADPFIDSVNSVWPDDNDGHVHTAYGRHLAVIHNFTQMTVNKLAEWANGTDTEINQGDCTKRLHNWTQSAMAFIDAHIMSCASDVASVAYSDMKVSFTTGVALAVVCVQRVLVERAASTVAMPQVSEVKLPRF
jgi:hypothetical protein